MLNIHTHRVTTLEDAEAWADARPPYRHLHTQAMVYRSESQPHHYRDDGSAMRWDAVPVAAADSAEGAAGIQDDSDFAEFDRPMPGLRSSLLMAASVVFTGRRWLAVSVGAVGLILLAVLR